MATDFRKFCNCGLHGNFYTLKESHKDVNQIGQHGLGFKSVFSYTNTPHIYSGECAFKIRDLIVPEPITPLNKQSNKTIFEFPFNNSEKTPTDAFDEIADGLRDLSTTTLLFLTNIKIIHWICADEPASYTRLHAHSKHHIEIEACLNGEVINGTHYLRFMGKIHDKPAHLQVGLAYSLNFKKGIQSFDTTKPLAEQMQVKNENGLVSIFFPAKNASSNLNFHIHAPFATVPGRNSISGTSEVASMNEELIAAIAQLAVSSLHDIKKIGLLNRAFLEVLPNSHDKISEFYQPISEQIWTALRTQPLIPIYSSDFMAGEQLYHATDDELRKLLDGADLALLENRTSEKLDWCFDVPEALRTKIGIKTINANYVITKLLNASFKLSNWLELKENTWMQLFYSYLQPHSLQLKQTPLVRLNEGSHVLASKAYFVTDDNFEDKHFPRVSVATYESGNEEQQEEREQARKFLDNIGVKKVGNREKIELRLKRYQPPPIGKISDEHYEDIKQFINFWKKSRYETSIFQTVGFLLAPENSHLSWQKATDICLDSPFIETGLAELIEIHQKKVLWQGYSEKLNETELRDFVEFVKAIGAMYKIEIIELNESNGAICKHSDKWSNKGKARDYSILNLEAYLRAKKISASRIIWNALIIAEGNVDKAWCEPNARSYRNSYDSQLISYLKKHAWIPNKSGEFLTPQAMTPNALRDDFPIYKQNGLLSAIRLVLTKIIFHNIPKFI